MKRVLIETVLVVIVGAAVGLGANAFSPRGLRLSRNYFPGSTAGTVAAPLAGPKSGTANTPALTNSAQLLSARIQELGFQAMDRDRVLGLFHDPLHAQDLIVFIDARGAAHFRDGHIPGAFEFDAYHPEEQLAAVLPACQNAEKVVLYCNGGQCEDSLFAAMFLRDAGVSSDKLFLYMGGFQDWTTNALPVETGVRNSGQISTSTP